MSTSNFPVPFPRGEPPDLTPEQFEGLVFDWLREWVSREGWVAELTRQGIVSGAGGEYAIDILLEFSLLSGARVIILVECKHQQRRVERDEVLVLEGKLRDVGAHKGMLFCNNGFQSGAVQYAAAHGIATISLQNGRYLYETRDLAGAQREPPPWVDIQPVVGVRLGFTGEGAPMGHVVERGRVDALVEWFVMEYPPQEA